MSIMCPSFIKIEPVPLKVWGGFHHWCFSWQSNSIFMFIYQPSPSYCITNLCPEENLLYRHLYTTVPQWTGHFRHLSHQIGKLWEYLQNIPSSACFHLLSDVSTCFSLLYEFKFAIILCFYRLCLVKPKIQ